jgi:hypothetical protein
MTSTSDLHNDRNISPDFSVVLGGPLYQFYLRSHLAKPPLELYKRRILIITLFTWLPMLLLAIIGGTAFSGVKIPFLYDIETHARFLAALPLFIAAELIVHQRIRIVVVQFLQRNIITQNELVRFNNIIASSIRLRNSIVAEVLIILLVITLGHWIWKENAVLNLATWYVVPSDNKLQLTLAGYWYVFISLPILQFIMLRWYFRLFVWYWFLWQVARLPLNLNSLHPDRKGGLGFLARSATAFWPVLMAHTIWLSGLIANRIWHAGATFPQFKFEMISIIIILMLLVLAPLFFLLPHLVKIKHSGTHEYGIVASRYVNDFRQKWFNDSKYEGEVLLGSSDIQSLADLSNSFEVTRKMHTLPFGRETIFQLMFLIILPLMPLIFTMVPIDEIIKRTIQLLL